MGCGSSVRRRGAGKTGNRTRRKGRAGRDQRPRVARNMIKLAAASGGLNGLAEDFGGNPE